MIPLAPGAFSQSAKTQTNSSRYERQGRETAIIVITRQDTILVQDESPDTDHLVSCSIDQPLGLDLKRISGGRSGQHSSVSNRKKGLEMDKLHFSAFGARHLHLAIFEQAQGRCRTAQRRAGICPDQR
jgi:hypothetical protein